jgi:amino acid transporter
MIDYILVVAVGISAGVGALVSAVPSLQPHTLALCLGILMLLTMINLRGVRETGLIFMAPTRICLLGAYSLRLSSAFSKLSWLAAIPCRLNPFPELRWRLPPGADG